MSSPQEDFYTQMRINALADVLRRKMGSDVIARCSTCGAPLSAHSPGALVECEGGPTPQFQP